jgi:glucose-6-phosphate 1-dehydrogenase
MNDSHSDALVFFGATGDLAYKKIFPALQAMLKRGLLNVPVIGVAKAGWNLDQLRARASDSLEKHGGLGLQMLSWSRSGIAATCTEVLGRFRKPPTAIEDGSLSQNYLRFRISPEMTIAVGATVMGPDEQMKSEGVEIVASRHPCPQEMDAYERVLSDAMGGDSTLFAREDYVEEAWRIVDPVLKAETPIYVYERGSWGPAEVRQRVEPEGGWHNPAAVGREDFRVAARAG